MNYTEIFNGFEKFISTNDIPVENKIIISIITVFIFSTIGFLLSLSLKLLRKSDLLGIGDYNVKNFIIWTFGAIMLQFLLISTKIINYNIFSFLFVALLWDKLYQKLFNKIKDKDISELDSIDKKYQK